MAINTVADLQKSLANYSYTGMTEAERRKAAEQLYSNQLNASKLSAQQSFDSNSLALQNQLNDLATNYESSRQNQAEATQKSISAADRQALTRGMQRSSYNNATLAGLSTAGDKALAAIDRNYSDNKQDIAANQSALQTTLSQNLAAAQSTYENNVLAKMQELEQQDYERKTAAQQSQNNLLLQIYQLQQAENAKSTSSSGGGGGGGGSGKDPVVDTTDTPEKRDYTSIKPLTLRGNSKVPIVSSSATPQQLMKLARKNTLTQSTK